MGQDNIFPDGKPEANFQTETFFIHLYFFSSILLKTYMRFSQKTN